MLKRAEKPFQFNTRLHLTELTGLRASTLMQLVGLLREVPGSCIYHHTHRLLQQHRSLSPEPPNDFAYWVTEVLGEDELGEELASIDIVRFPTIRSLREKLIEVIEEYLQAHSWAHLRFAREGEEFHFVKSVSFILPTPNLAYDLGEFADCLSKITLESLYFHMFEARLRLEKKTNDFSLWLETSLGEHGLAEHIARLDPYTYTLEDLRTKLIALIKERIRQSHDTP